jgi:Pathogenicity locus
MQESSRKRRLIDLRSVGPATVADFKLLGIAAVEDLVDCDAGDLYARLCAVTGIRHDPCCEDVFAAAIAQARDPDLPPEQRDWAYRSRLRKARPGR